MNLSNYKEDKPHYKKRILWYLINHSVFRILVGRPFRKTRNAILRAFGATIDTDAYVYGSCMIFAPWNLVVGRACIGPNTQLYCKNMIIIGDDCVVSQGTYLCTASHDVSSLMLPLKTAPIVIEDNVWIAADAFVSMGVTIGEGAVVGARAVVTKDVEPWTIVAGNPAKFIKKRVLRDA